MKLEKCEEVMDLLWMEQISAGHFIFVIGSNEMKWW